MTAVSRVSNATAGTELDDILVFVLRVVILLFDVILDVLAIIVLLLSIVLSSFSG